MTPLIDVLNMLRPSDPPENKKPSRGVSNPDVKLNICMFCFALMISRTFRFKKRKGTCLNHHVESFTKPTFLVIVLMSHTNRTNSRPFHGAPNDVKLQRLGRSWRSLLTSGVTPLGRNDVGRSFWGAHWKMLRAEDQSTFCRFVTPIL